MTEQPTCGEGLAAHSALPAKLAALTAAVAEVLENHAAALDMDDEKARRERDIYLKLVAEHRKTAAELRSTAEEMRGARDLPMARHDPSMLSSPAVARAFETFVTLEEELLGLLQERLTDDREMLREMRTAA